MTLAGRECTDCERVVTVEFEKTITGREVCADCARALRTATAVGAASDIGAGLGVWARLTGKTRRTG
jgi:hypothetical protein